MSSWTPARFILLSQLLDDVVGTEQMMRIRQDYCKITDFIRSTGSTINTYFTGSKAEGLDLPGSDKDFMFDINKIRNMQVMQTEHDTPGATHSNLFVMSTENIRPCFAMLRSVNPISAIQLRNACQEIDSSLYLNRYLYVHNSEAEYSKSRPHIATTRQGPSMELWSPYIERSESGTDAVL